MQDDRRSFFKIGAKDGLSIVLDRLGVVGAVAGQVIKNAGAVDKSNSEKTRHLEKMILKSGDPINTAGDPLGGQISGFSLIPQTLNPRHQDRYLLILSHAKKRVVPEGVVSAEIAEQLRDKSIGVSIIEIRKDTQNRWQHVPSGQKNTMLHPLNTDSDARIGALCGCHVTAWNSVIFFENDGYVSEFFPQRGSLVKRHAIGKLKNLSSFYLDILPGEKPLLYLGREDGNIVRFESEGKFDSQNNLSNSRLLDSGVLSQVESGSNPRELSIISNMIKFTVADVYSAELETGVDLVCRNTGAGVEVFVSYS